jgi:hypothetical protein
MKGKKICSFLFILAIVVRLEAHETFGLPVLRVSFEGSIMRDMPYSNGQMQLTDTDGSVVELPARFRTRGATAQEYLVKPSLNMKLSTADYSEEVDSALLGMRSCSSWIMDAMAIDRICMRNRVAFDIWNDFSRLPYDTDFNGRNGTEGRFVEVYINNQYYGIYCLTDRINRKLLNLKKVKESEDGSVVIRGALYKSGTQNILNQNEPTYSEDSVACVIEWHNAWELKYPEEYAGHVVWQPLQDAYTNGRRIEYVKKYFYMENLVDYHLLVMALGIVDNWGNKNRFFSIRNIGKDINDPDPSESDRRRFVVTPWDLDTSLGGSYNGSNYGGHYTEWPVDILSKIAPYPNSVLQEDAEYRALLKSRWITVRNGAFSPLSVRAKLKAYRDLFIKSGAWQRMINHFDNRKGASPCYVTDLDGEIESIMDWYTARFFEVDAYFDITDTDVIDGINSKKLKVKNGDATYDLNGRKMDGSRLLHVFYVNGGKKFLIQR